jgi:hypothetical protein
LRRNKLFLKVGGKHSLRLGRVGWLLPTEMATCLMARLEDHRSAMASCMITRKLGTILTGCYLALATAAVAYELSIRIYDRGNSEFAGMLSMAVTLPASLLLVWMSKAAFSVNVGDSDVSFLAILGLSALANAGVIWMILVMLSRQK